MTDDSKKFIKEGALPIYESPDGKRLFRAEDVAEPFQTDLRERMKNASLRGTIAAYNSQPNWEYGLVDHTLPEGAHAVVIRPVGSNGKPLLIFDKSLVNDRLVSLSRLVLLRARTERPEIATQEMVLVWANGNVKVGEQIMSMGTVTTMEGGETEAFRSAHGRRVAVPGIGEVQILGSAEDF